MDAMPSAPLRVSLRALLKSIEEINGVVPDFIDRLINTAIMRLDLAEKERLDLAMSKVKIETLRGYIREYEKTITDIHKDLAEADELIDEKTRIITQQESTIEKMEERIEEAEERNNGLNSYVDYLIRRLEKYVGIPKQEFETMYLAWAEKKAAEIQANENKERNV